MLRNKHKSLFCQFKMATNPSRFNVRPSQNTLSLLRLDSKKLILMSDSDLSEFPETNHSQWAENAVKELNGKGLDSLSWHYDPDVINEPYYSPDGDHSSGLARLHSEILPDGNEGRLWHYLECIKVSDLLPEVKAANKVAHNVLNNGADGVLWEFDNFKPESIDAVFNGIEFQYCQTVFKPRQWDAATKAFFASLLTTKSLLGGGLPGWLFYDPASSTQQIKELDELFPDGLAFRPHCFDATSAPGSQLSPSAQIGYLLSKFIERMATLLDERASVRTFMGRSVFCVSTGRDFFHEIAKIRALKIAIAQAASHFGPESIAPSEVKVHAQPNTNTYSVVDPYVNMVRLTAAAMASVEGGANYITLSRFDEKNPFAPGHFSSRISRNISALLTDESYFDKNTDPCAGSYFLEDLTQRLAKSGWEKMQQAEKLGGFSLSMQNGYWLDEAQRFTEKEKALVDSRKMSVVGVNNFCDLTLFTDFPLQKEIVSNTSGTPDQSIIASFEKLRLATETYLASNKGATRPQVTAIVFGDEAFAMARYRFVKGLLPAAGIDVSTPLRWPFADNKKPYSGSKLIVLCSSDQGYISSVVAIVQELRLHHPGAYIVIAGNPDGQQETLISQGVNDFVHLKSDFIAVLSSYQKLFGI